MKKETFEDQISLVIDKAPAESRGQLEFDWVIPTETNLDQEETDSNLAENELVDEIREKLEGAVSKNTLRAYIGDLRNFIGWCLNNDHIAIPAEVATLEAYVEWMATCYKAATIRRRLDSLGSIFHYLKLPNATKDPEVKLAMKRCFRAIGRYQKQASPLTKELLGPMLKVCGNDLRGLRNRVLLQLGYESLRRRSEICSLRFEDINSYPNGTPYILLRFSKTDQFGDGRPIPISRELYELIERWRRKIKVEEGFILRAIGRGGKAENSLDPSSVNVILKDLQREAFGCRCKESLSGHSFRVGGAIDLLEQGETLDRIMVRAGWRSESTAIRYLRNYVSQMNNTSPEPDGR